MNIAIYDLDKTITRRPTFTRFLLYFAWRRQPFRLAGLPLWTFALIGYRLGLYGRKPLKQFGLTLFVGRKIAPGILQDEASNFITEIVMNDLAPGVIQSIETDRQSGYRLMIATAAPEFYAIELGARLGFQDVVATRHVVAADGFIVNQIDGENCYGEVKLAMVQEWFAKKDWRRDHVHVRFYTDHRSDAPMLDWANEALLVGASHNKRLRALAKARRWQIVDFHDRQS